jgi:hypothetical protein
MEWSWWAVLDMNRTEISVSGEQEQSPCNGHFESTCYHPLLMFNSEDDCVAARLRPGNVHSAEGCEELLLPEIEWQQQRGKEVWFRADRLVKYARYYWLMLTEGHLTRGRLRRCCRFRQAKD